MNNKRVIKSIWKAKVNNIGNHQIVEILKKNRSEEIKIDGFVYKLMETTLTLNGGLFYFILKTNTSIKNKFDWSI